MRTPERQDPLELDEESRAMSSPRLYGFVVGVSVGVVLAGLGVGGFFAGVAWPWPAAALAIAQGCFLVAGSARRRMVAPRWGGRGSAGFLSSSLFAVGAAWAFRLSARTARQIADLPSSPTQQVMEARWGEVGESLLLAFLGICVIATCWLLFFELRPAPLQQLVEEEREKRKRQRPAPPKRQA